MVRIRVRVRVCDRAHDGHEGQKGNGLLQSARQAVEALDEVRRALDGSSVRLDKGLRVAREHAGVLTDDLGRALRAEELDERTVRPDDALRRVDVRQIDLRVLRARGGRLLPAAVDLDQRLPDRRELRYRPGDKRLAASRGALVSGRQAAHHLARVRVGVSPHDLLKPPLSLPPLIRYRCAGDATVHTHHSDVSRPCTYREGCTSGGGFPAPPPNCIAGEVQRAGDAVRPPLGSSSEAVESSSGRIIFVRAPILFQGSGWAVISGRGDDRRNCKHSRLTR